MDLKVLNQFLTNLNAQRYSNEISHAAWFRTINCLADTVESAGYTWNDLVTAGE